MSVGTFGNLSETLPIPSEVRSNKLPPGSPWHPKSFLPTDIYHILPDLSVNRTEPADLSSKVVASGLELKIANDLGLGVGLVVPVWVEYLFVVMLNEESVSDEFPMLPDLLYAELPGCYINKHKTETIITYPDRR